MDYRELPEYEVGCGRASIHSRNEWDFESSEHDIGDCTTDCIRSTMMRIIDPRKHDSYHSAGVEVIGSLTVEMDVSESFDSPWESPWIYFEVAQNDQMMLIITAYSMRDIATQEFRDTVATMGNREGILLLHISPFDEFGMGFKSDDGRKGEAELGVTARRFEIYFLLPSKFGVISEVIRFARLVQQEIYFHKIGIRSPKVAEKVIEIGQIERLIGMRENIWLEVKSAPYEMKKNENQWKVELATDVASFANSERGGILILGMGTHGREGHNEVIKEVRPVPVSGNRIQKYLATIDERIHPPVSGLSVGEVPFGKGVVVYILIPAQFEEVKPFLVQGAFWDEKFQGAAILIPRRRDEHSIPVKAREIHSMLVAGRYFLRSGRLPVVENENPE